MKTITEIIRKMMIIQLYLVVSIENNMTTYLTFIFNFNFYKNYYVFPTEELLCFDKDKNYTVLG